MTDALAVEFPDQADQLYQPRLAEMIAGVLRSRIVEGEIADGARLPKQDELLREFRVSRPSLREALRILEAEGLVVVKRGNVGGAVVRAPNAQSSARSFGLVLQSRHVMVEDLAEAIRNVEPVAAMLCARRKDRRKTVIPRLRAAQESVEASIGDGAAFTSTARQFHEELVRACGNETITVMLGTFEAMWSEQEKQWARWAESRGSYPAPKAQKEVLAAHQALLRSIELGDEEHAARLARSHLDKSQRYTLAEAHGAVVQAPPMRGTAT